MWFLNILLLLYANVKICVVMEKVLVSISKHVFFCFFKFNPELFLVQQSK